MLLLFESNGHGSYICQCNLHIVNKTGDIHALDIFILHCFLRAIVLDLNKFI